MSYRQQKLDAYGFDLKSVVFIQKYSSNKKQRAEVVTERNFLRYSLEFNASFNHFQHLFVYFIQVMKRNFLRYSLEFNASFTYFQHLFV